MSDSHDNTEQTPEAQNVKLSKKLSTYAALVALYIIAGGLFALTISSTTDYWLKVGILALIGVIGWACARTGVIITRFYDSEREAVANMTPVIALSLVIPPLMVAFLYGLI